MRIGELARDADVSVRVVRHYESQGLIASQRLANGYRDYSLDQVQTVRWIRELIDCGFSTRQIHNFLHCLGSEKFDPAECAAGLAQYQEKLAELDKLIAVLSERRRKLSEKMSVMFGDLSPTSTLSKEIDT
jgi:DNA-binding transcriptional MerR regulator